MFEITFTMWLLIFLCGVMILGFICIFRLINGLKRMLETWHHYYRYAPKEISDERVKN